MAVSSLSRRLQTLAVAWHVFTIPILTSLFLLCCSFPPLWPFIIIYLVYMFFDKSDQNGAAVERKSKWVAGRLIWGRFAEFFPITLYKTVELEPAFREVDKLEEVEEKEKEGEGEGQTGTVTPVPTYSLKRTASDSDQASILSTTTIATDTDELDHSASDKKSTRVPTILQHSREPSIMAQPATEAPQTWLGWLFSPSSSKKTNQTKKERTGTQYIFGYHPHGIIGMGALAAIATEGTFWSRLFPGIPTTLLTINNQFSVPLYREYLLSLGLASVSKKSCTALLDKGQSIVIVVGGAQESLLARPGTMDLVLAKRKGFVKLAMSVPGTSLVPVLGFGENDLYDQVQNDPSSRLFQIQTFLKNKIGFTVPLMHARGIFTYDFGIIPYRRPLNIVVGAPIPVPVITTPSAEQIDYYHGLYVDAVKKLFETHKERFHRDHVGDNKGCVYQDLKIVA